MMTVEKNCSSISEVPTSDVYLSHLRVGWQVAITLCGAITLAVIVLYFEQIYFFFSRLGTWKPRDKAVWLIGIYPVFCLTSLVALLVPRSALLDNMVSSLYLSICVYLFVGMLIGHYGGAKRMSKKLAHFPIPIRTPPCCCCCFCLPESAQMTTFRLQVLESLVLQYAVLKPMTSYVAAILASDDKFVLEDLSISSPFLWLSVINGISTLVALYGFLLVYRVSRVPLQKMCVKPKFVCLQLVLILSNFQLLFVGVLVKLQAVPCDPPLSAKANGERWHHVALIIEMFFISLAARSYYRRHVGDLPADIEAITDGNHTVATEGLSHNQDDGPTYGSTSQDHFQNGVLVLRDNDSSADPSEIKLSIARPDSIPLDLAALDVGVGIDNPVYGAAFGTRSPSVSAMAGSLDSGSRDGSISEGLPSPSQETVCIEVTEDASET